MLDDLTIIESALGVGICYPHIAESWQRIKKLAEAQATSTNTTRDEICPVTAVQCEFGRVKVVCIRQGIFCPHVGQTSPVA